MEPVIHVRVSWCYHTMLEPQYGGVLKDWGGRCGGGGGGGSDKRSVWKAHLHIQVNLAYIRIGLYAAFMSICDLNQTLRVVNIRRLNSDRKIVSMHIYIYARIPTKEHRHAFFFFSRYSYFMKATSWRQPKTVLTRNLTTKVTQ